MNYYRPKLRQISRILRKNMTPQEKHLWYDFLQAYRPRFYRQKPMSNYVLDFYCPQAKTAIELDGGQHYEEDALIKDEARTLALKTSESMYYAIQIIKSTILLFLSAKVSTGQ